jgi:hypothetical protein
LGETNKTPDDWVFSITPGAKKTPVVKISTFSLPKYKASNGTSITETEYKAVDSTAVTITEYKNADNTYTYSLPANTPNANGVIKITRGNVEVANITIEWDYEALGELQKSEAGTNYGVEIAKVDNSATDDSKVELEITAEAGEGALIKTSLNTVKGAYELTENSGQLARTLTSEFSSDDSKFQKMSFNLTAAITDSANAIKDWDAAFTSTSGTQLEITWAVTKSEVADPTAEVTTEMASASDSAVLKVDWGYGDNLATAISAASFKNASGATVAVSNVDNVFTVDESDDTVVTVNLGTQSGIFFNGEGKLTITFSNSATGFTKDVTVDLKAAETA